MDGCSKFKNCRRSPLHLDESGLHTARRHVHFQSFPIAMCNSTISDIRNTIAQPTALVGIKATKNNVVFDLFGQILRIRTVVKVFIRKSTMETHLIK